MVRAERTLSKKLTQAQLPRQIGIAFESRYLQGLTSTERRRVLTHLANLLTQAAGLTPKESSHEPR
jgi:transcriptional regulator with XRE-family HTH domain